ncbi:MAG: glycosyltransferase family 4 protein, partial [Flavobacteriaceae bacterium]
MKNQTKYLRVVNAPHLLEIQLNGQMHFLNHKGFEVYLVSPGSCPPTLKSFVHFKVPMTRRLSPLKDLVSLIKLVWIVLKIRPDIIHSHTPKAGLLSMISAKLIGVPIRIHTIPGLPQSTAFKWEAMALNLSDFITMRYATKVLFNSANLLQSQSDKYPKLRDKFGIIHNGSSNGIDIRRFSANQHHPDKIDQQQFKSSLFTWIYVGRIHQHKGIRELLDAFFLFDKNYPGKSQLIIIGEFDAARNSIKNNWIDRLSLENSNIHFKGFKTNVKDWLEISDVFLFPSYREGFPNALLEAACFGLPCIASEIDGNNEIIIDGKNGLLVPSRDTQKLYDAMKLMYHSPELRESF